MTDMTRPFPLRRRLLSGATATAALALTTGSVRAQTSAAPAGWPARPVRLVVPAAAGGQTDQFARFVAEHLSRVFGQPFVVDNRPGGAGAIGAVQVAKAAPDGHALLFSAASFTVVPQALNPNQQYDLLRDLAPVVQIGAGGNFLAASVDSPIRTPKDLIDRARATPDALSYGTTGVGSVPHILMSALLGQHGARMAHVPYKSGAEVLRDLVGGVLQVGWVDTTTGGPAGAGGRIRLLGISGTFRVPGNPEVATLAEQGFGSDLNGWLGLFAPTGTPDPVVRAVNAEVNRLMGLDEARKRLDTMNVASFPRNAPDEFARTVRSDVQAWRRIVVDNGIKVE
jgi:tripartite-type tricarboxylate transporter receptor subunit TctC